MKATMYCITKARGEAAWSAARKWAEATGIEAYHRRGEKLICHSRRSYREGKLGDYGLCGVEATTAWENSGVWVECTGAKTRKWLKDYPKHIKKVVNY